MLLSSCHSTDCWLTCDQFNYFYVSTENLSISDDEVENNLDISATSNLSTPIRRKKTPKRASKPPLRAWTSRPLLRFSATAFFAAVFNFYVATLKLREQSCQLKN